MKALPTNPFALSNQCFKYVPFAHPWDLSPAEDGHFQSQVTKVTNVPGERLDRLVRGLSLAGRSEDGIGCPTEMGELVDGHLSRYSTLSGFGFFFLLKAIKQDCP